MQRKQRIVNLKSWFLKYRTPSQFIINSTRISYTLGVEYVITNTRTSWLREAWVIGKYAKSIQAEAVALNSEDPPDARIIFKGVPYQVEITEAMDPGRKRNEEYKNSKNEFDPYSQGIWGRSPFEAFSWAYNQIIKKINKRNIKDDVLILCYLNPYHYFWNERQSVEAYRFMLERDRRLRDRALVFHAHGAFAPSWMISDNFCPNPDRGVEKSTGWSDIYH